MKGKQQGIIWDPWMHEAIMEFGRRNSKDFTNSVKYLVEAELNARGYYRDDYEPGIVDKRKSQTTEESIPDVKKKAQS